MVEFIIQTIYNDIRESVLEPLPKALALTILVMYVFKSGSSVKEVAGKWIHWFRSESWFRRACLWVFYNILVLYRTALGRRGHINPFSNLLGPWGFHRYIGGTRYLTAEPLENLMLFIPFTFLLFWSMEAKNTVEKTSSREILRKSLIFSFLFSLSIETIQIIFRIGTLQLSDLFHNTLGGLIGGVLYLGGRKIYAIIHREVSEKSEKQ